MFTCPFNVGDRVMFKNRVQTTTVGMVITKIDYTLFGPRIQIDHEYSWWVPGNFITFKEWKELVQELAKSC